jgi:hypothetical protein
MIFPINATTYGNTISGNSSFTLLQGTSNFEAHILSVAMQQEKNKDTIVYCGSELIAVNYGLDYPQILMDYPCFSEDLEIVQVGNGEAFVHIIYTTSTPIYASTTISNVYATNGFFYGDIIIITFLIIGFMTLFFGGIWNRLIGVKSMKSMQNYYLGNNSKEGKKHYYD